MFMVWPKARYASSADVILELCEDSVLPLRRLGKFRHYVPEAHVPVNNSEDRCPTPVRQVLSITQELDETPDLRCRRIIKGIGESALPQLIGPDIVRQSTANDSIHPITSDLVTGRRPTQSGIVQE